MTVKLGTVENRMNEKTTSKGSKINLISLKQKVKLNRKFGETEVNMKA